MFISFPLSPTCPPNTLQCYMRGGVGGPSRPRTYILLRSILTPSWCFWSSALNISWLAFDMLIADLINLNTGRGDRPLCNIDTLWPEARFFTTGETNDSVNFYWQDGRHNPHSWWSQRKKRRFLCVTFVRFYIQTNIRNRKKMRKNILIHSSWKNEFPNIFIWKGMVQISNKRIL